MIESFNGGIQESPVERNETPKNSCRVLMAGPSFLAGFAYVPGEEVPGPARRTIDNDLLCALYAEYRTIYDKVVEAAGSDNVVVAKTSPILEKYLVDGTSDEIGFSMPEELSCGEIVIDYLDPLFACWPRNAFSCIGDQVFATPEAWRGQEDNQVVLSPLGDSGQIIVKGESIIVTPTIWNACKKSLKELQANGFKVARIPHVNPARQKYFFKEDDLDGHIELVANQQGNLSLLVARSFFNQGRYQGEKTAETIRAACDLIGANLIVVKDKELPPLALNMLQLDDSSVIFTGPSDSCLSEELKTIVGAKKLFPTNGPIRLIPEKCKGGIGCLTNILPYQFWEI